MEFRLRLQDQKDGSIEVVQNATTKFIGMLPETQTALLKAREIYGERTFVEFELDGNGTHCWIWMPVIGSNEILGSGEDWDTAFAQAEENNEKRMEMEK